MIRPYCYLLLTLTLALFATTVSPAAADIFRLTTGGEIRGEWLNANDTTEPRKQYIVRTYSGVAIMLPAEIVQEVDEQRPKEVEYEKRKFTTTNTVDGHLKMAEWCKDQHLTKQRENHLAKVLKLDYNHEHARRLLGFTEHQGRWITRDQLMEEQGFVRYQGRWMLPQVVDQRERDQKRDDAERNWKQKLHRLAGNLNTSRDRQSRTSIEEIDDEYAVPALMMQIEKAHYDRDKILFAKALMRIGTKQAVEAIVVASINDRSEDFRFTCLDLIERDKPEGALDTYIKGLSPKLANNLINRAAMGLERLEDPRAVDSLIDALVTKHRRQVSAGGGADSISTGFGTDPNGNPVGSGGLSMGAKAKFVTDHVRNDHVLAALVKITGEDFHFDVEGWRLWWARENQQPHVVPGRRDR